MTLGTTEDELFIGGIGVSSGFGDAVRFTRAVS
jgi:hypothetical protein